MADVAIGAVDLDDQAAAEWSDVRRVMDGHMPGGARTSGTEDVMRLYLHDVRTFDIIDPADHPSFFQVMRRGQAAQKMLEEAKVSPQQISRADILRLKNDVTRGSQARGYFISTNLPLVVKCAKSYQRRGLALPDLVQEGSLGLMTAVDNFNQELGNLFSTYAVPKIRAAIQRGLDNTAHTVRYPVGVEEKIRQVADTQRRLTDQLDRVPDRSELAEELNDPLEALDELMLRVHESRNINSLDRPSTADDGGSASFGDMVASDYDLTQEVEKSWRKQQVRAMLQESTEKQIITEAERMVLELRFGIEDDSQEGLTLKETGKNLGITQERVRQLQKRALDRLRTSYPDF